MFDILMMYCYALVYIINQKYGIDLLMWQISILPSNIVTIFVLSSGIVTIPVHICKTLPYTTLPLCTYSETMDASDTFLYEFPIIFEKKLSRFVIIAYLLVFSWNEERIAKSPPNGSGSWYFIQQYIQPLLGAKFW